MYVCYVQICAILILCLIMLSIVWIWLSTVRGTNNKKTLRGAFNLPISIPSTTHTHTRRLISNLFQSFVTHTHLQWANVRRFPMAKHFKSVYLLLPIQYTLLTHGKNCDKYSHKHCHNWLSLASILYWNDTLRNKSAPIYLTLKFMSHTKWMRVCVQIYGGIQIRSFW